MPRIIKRYDNRKLYDVEAKQYVRLRDLAGLIQAGQEVVVLDNATGADITAQTLTKVVVEGAGENQSFLPSQFLHEVVRKSGALMASGANQIEEGFDRLIRGSLERIGPLRGMRRELSQLRERLEKLEALLQELDKEDNDGSDDDGRGGQQRASGR